jgi:hypothetical protein
LTNRIRQVLEGFFPAALAAFERGGRHRLDSPACRVVLAAAPTPTAAARLTPARQAALLRRAGHLAELLRTPQPRQPEAVEAAMGVQLMALLGQLDAVCRGPDALTAAAEARQLDSLRRRQALPVPVLHLGLTHPQPERHRVHPCVAGDWGDPRVPGADEPHGLRPELRWVRGAVLAWHLVGLLPGRMPQVLRCPRGRSKLSPT